jgi:1-deoxy-D-xylulose-5-phosphate reductoisomerase
MRTHTVTILGSTGSIGRNTLKVLDGFRREGDEVRIAALAAHRSVDELIEQARQWQPALAVIGDEACLSTLEAGLSDLKGTVGTAAGPEGVVGAATHPEAEIVVNALVGSAGLVPTVRALESGRRVALANKESLVVGGPLVTGLAGSSTADGQLRLIPVDSEHSALLQALGEHPEDEVERLILTASGGPFRETPIGEFGGITAKQALNHPTWNMGPKITVDSATLMNKGLEVIEAHWLFGLPVERIDVVVHPQSIVHSLVEFIDGNILAHFSVPDMRLPIQYALTYPQRAQMVSGKRLGIEDLEDLRFEPPDEERFPALGLCRLAVEAGGTLPAVLNAANEVAVAGFLDGSISFMDIPASIRAVMEAHQTLDSPDLEDLLEAIAWGTERARETIRTMARES